MVAQLLNSILHQETVGLYVPGANRSRTTKEVNHEAVWASSLTSPFRSMHMEKMGARVVSLVCCAVLCWGFGVPRWWQGATEQEVMEQEIVCHIQY